MEEKIRKSLRYSLNDGICASVMNGFSETFMTPYAIAMKASSSLIGILASMPNLVGALLQVKSAELTERLGSRKALINSSVLIHALLWIPIISVPYIFKENQPVFLIIFYTLFISIGAISLPPWSSLMADHVPETERGKIFGRRNRIFGIINVSSMFLAGSMLYLFAKNFRFLGFTIIFLVAFVARLLSWNFLRKMYEPDLVIKDEHRFTILNFLKRMRRSNFGRFVLFVSTMNFSVNIAAPFFAVYMLRDLKFDYFTYTIITIAATLTSLFMMNNWGLRADHVGNIKVLKLTSRFLPFIPILWIFSHNMFYLILIQIFSGFFWAGFNLSASNFIYDAVMPEKRTRCVAYFNVVNGLALFSGATIGGYLIKILPPLFGYQVLTLLLISGVLRFLATTLASFVKEVRQVRYISNLELFYSMISGKPLFSQVSSGKE